MWKEVLEKVSYLKALDKQYQAFGAETHRYRFLHCPSSAEIEGVENRLNSVIPNALRVFYQDIGNGVVGPDYGLKPIAELSGYFPDKPYTDVRILREMAYTEYQPESEQKYFEVNHELLTGLISIIDQGCGHEICLITSQPRAGNVVYVSADGYVVETDETVIDLYHQWLDKEIQEFEAVKALMKAGTGFQQIENEMAARFHVYDAGDIISSIANVAKPPALFGTGYNKRYHGASQFPWYESVLQEWQNTNNSSHAQQSTHWTLGILRRFQAFFKHRKNSAP